MNKISILMVILLVMSAFASTALGGKISDPFSMSLEELLDVEVVTASRRLVKLRDSIATTYVITGEELRSLGARTIYDALIHIPGLTYSQNRGGANKVFFRGAGSEYSSQIIFMLDNHVINDLISGGIGAFTDHLPVENIERIEVVHGPVSSLYGANAFLGIINIITRKGENIEGAQGSIRAEFDDGGHAANYYNILTGYEFGNGWQAALNLHCLNGSGPELPVDSDMFGRNGHADASQEYYNVDFRVENEDVILRGHYFHRTAGGFFGIANVLNDGTEYGHTNMFMDARYLIYPVEDLTMEFHAGIDYRKFDSFYEIIPPGSIPKNSILYPWNESGDYSRLKSRENEYNAELRSTWSGFPGNLLSLGLSYTYQELTDPKTYANHRYMDYAPLPDMEDVTDSSNWIRAASRNNYAVYLQDNWQITEELKLTASGRYDYYTDFGSTFNPRFGILYQITPDYQFRMLYGRAFRAPDFGSQYVQNNIVIQGNPGLDPEHIDTMEVGFRGSISENFYCAATYYYNDLDDLIGFDNSMPRQYRNIGGLTVNGVEIQARYDFSSIQFRANYSWNDVNSSPLSASVSVPANSGTLEVNWQLTDFLHWNINAYAQDSSPRVKGDPRADMNGYVLLNTTLNINLGRYAGLQFSMFNMTDEDYAYPDPSGTMSDDYTAPGRSFLMGLRLSY